MKSKKINGGVFMHDGNFRCYEWQYCGPEFSCFIIITLTPDRENRIVKSEYFVLPNDESSTVIQNELTPLHFPYYFYLPVINFKGSREALLVAQGHASSVLFTAHRYTNLCQGNHSTVVRTSNNKFALMRWYQNSKLKQKIEVIEDVTCCRRLRQMIHNIRQLR